jgi:putative spermidine/putrescine transport system substrate-binding protein
MTEMWNRFSRRGALGLGLGAGGLMLSTPWVRAFAQELESELVFACNGGKTQEEFEKSFFPDFTAKTGASVTYVAGQPADNLAKVRAQAGAASIDALWLAGGVTYQAIRDELVQPLDKSKLPNYEKTLDNLKTQERAAAIGLTTCGIIYNEEVFAAKGWDAPTSWWDLWDPKYAGGVGCYSINATSACAFLVKISQILTGDYKNLDAAFAKFAELTPNMAAFYTSAGAYDTAMQQGDVWIGMNTSVRAQQMKDGGAPIGFVQPKEGMAGYETWAGVVTGAPHPNVAHAWIDYLLSTEAQTLMPQTIGYSPVNREATIPPELSLYFPDLSTVFVPDWQYLSGVLPDIVDRWNREVEV